MNSKWDCTMYYEEVNDGCYEGHCKLDNTRCYRRSWSCKQYIRPDETSKDKEISRLKEELRKAKERK
jgi:hypothetical protein